MVEGGGVEGVQREIPAKRGEKKKREGGGCCYTEELCQRTLFSANHKAAIYDVSQANLVFIEGVFI